MCAELKQAVIELLQLRYEVNRSGHATQTQIAKGEAQLATLVRLVDFKPEPIGGEDG